MTHDYGLRSAPSYGRRTRIISGLGAAACALLGLALLIDGGVQLGGADRAEMSYWTVAGPACRQMTYAGFKALHIPTEAPFMVGRVSFARAYGHADCREFPIELGFDSYSICQFTSPDVVTVSTARGDFYFAPGVGRVATVSTAGATPTCVLGSNFG